MALLLGVWEENVDTPKARCGPMSTWRLMCIARLCFEISSQGMVRRNGERRSAAVVVASREWAVKKFFRRGKEARDRLLDDEWATSPRAQKKPSAGGAGTYRGQWGEEFDVLENNHRNEA